MNKGEVQDAERYALNEFDKWNDVTDQFTKGTSYYYEMQGVISDAVHIGIQMALYGKVDRDDYDNIKIPKSTYNECSK